MFTFFCKQVHDMNTPPSTIRHSVRIFATLVTLAVVSMVVADIQAQTWNQTAAGTGYNWQTTTNWTPNTVPNGVDAVASLTNNIAGAQTISLNGTVTLGTLNIGDSTATFLGFTLQNGTGGSLTFDVASGSAAINKTGSGTTTTDTISATISLKSNLNVTNSAGSRLTISGAIGENSSGKSITIASGINDLNNASNSFTGGVNITGGAQLYALSLANAGSNSALGNSGTIALGSVATAGILGFSSLSANSTTDRAVDLAGTTGGGSILSSATYAVKFTGNFTASGAGSKTLTLRGTNTGNNEISGAIVDNSAINKTSISKSDAGAWILSGNSSYTGGVTVGAGTLSFTSVANTGINSALGAAGTIKIGTTATTGTLNYTGTGTTSSNRTVDLAGTTGGATINANGSGTLKFTNNFTASGAGSKLLRLGGNNTGANEISGAIVNNSVGNTSALTKADAGTWILSGNNTYTGATTISAGTLQIGANGTSGALSTSSTLTNNGTLVFNRSNNITQGTDFANVIAGTGNLTQAGSSTLALGGTNTFTGVTTLSAGSISISTSTALGSTSGINLGNATTLIYTGSAATLDRAISVTSGTGTIHNTGSGLLTLSGGLTKNSTALTLKGGSNGITVSGAISGASANSDLIIDGGTVNLTSANTYNGPTSLVNGATLNANGTNALPIAHGLSAVSIDNTGTGGSTFALGASQSIASLSGSASSNVTLGSNTLTMSAATGSTNHAGRISGTGGLLKDGASTQILSGTNTYTGATTISAGTLQIGANGTSGALSTSSALTNNGTLVFNRSNTITQGTDFANAITGTGAVIKDGGGTLVLNAANTYTGSTTVNSGTLAAAAANALGSTSNVIVNNGGSFLVTADDAIGSSTNVTLGSGNTTAGLIFNGNYNGTVGALTLSADSIIDLGTDSVRVIFASIAGLGSYNLSIWNWTGNAQYPGPAGGGTDQLVFTDASGFTNNLSKVSFYGGAGTSLISTSGFLTGSPSEIVAVPEPSAIIAAILLLCGLGVQFFRTRKSLGKR
jgi:fibronectin-binding autotransporter adhesin